MASLIENLINNLDSEKEGYTKLYELSRQKRTPIVNRDIAGLEDITSKEQIVSSQLKNLENKRVAILKDMAVVLGHDGEELTVTKVIDFLEKQPKEQEALRRTRDQLVEAANQMHFMNQQNQLLLEQAMEMVEFDLNLFKSMRQAPETANYNSNAYNTGDLLPQSGFDAKQ